MTSRTIETAIATATILSDRIVLVRAKTGVNITAFHAADGDRLIAESMPGPYGQIIDRQEDYSSAPVEVFNILNRNEKLKAIAVVVHRRHSSEAAAIERRLFRGRLEVFHSLAEARHWLEQLLS